MKLFCAMAHNHNRPSVRGLTPQMLNHWNPTVKASFLLEINVLIDYRPQANRLPILLLLCFLDQWTFVAAGGRLPCQSYCTKTWAFIIVCLISWEIQSLISEWYERNKNPGEMRWSEHHLKSHQAHTHITLITSKIPTLPTWCTLFCVLALILFFFWGGGIKFMVLLFIDSMWKTICQAMGSVPMMKCYFSCTLNRRVCQINRIECV